MGGDPFLVEAYDRHSQGRVIPRALIEQIQGQQSVCELNWALKNLRYQREANGGVPDRAPVDMLTGAFWIHPVRSATDGFIPEDWELDFENTRKTQLSARGT